MLKLRPQLAGRFTPALLPEYAIRGFLQIGEVPIGAYRIESVGIDEPAGLTSILRGHDLPAEKLDPERGGRRPVQPHGIIARTGEKDMTFLAGPAGSLFTTNKESPGGVWSPDNPAVFTVWAAGYAPALVTEQDFHARGNRLLAEPVMSPGWGVLLAFRAGDPKEKDPAGPPRAKRPRMAMLKDLAPFTMPPLPGVRVESNGVLLGTSDAEGCVLVTRTARPDQLTLVAPGWRLCAIERIQGSGSRWWAWMKRDP
jgi:hypothetical protein